MRLLMIIMLLLPIHTSMAYEAARATLEISVTVVNSQQQAEDEKANPPTITEYVDEDGYTVKQVNY